MISYIIDENGKKTHVIIPIEMWDNNKEEIKGNTQIEMPVIEDMCPNKHLYNLIPLLEGMELDSIEEWQKKYHKFFKYMQGLKYKDIYLFYLIRSEEFLYNLRHCENEDALDLFKVYYRISKISGDDINIADIKDLNSAVYSLSDNEFLKYFNAKYKVDIEDKKIRIDAEINRLFIFDVIERFPKCMEVEYDITPKEAQKKLMKFLYKNSTGAKTQVQRALKQAISRTI